jgi:hypothetical protein
MPAQPKAFVEYLIFRKGGFYGHDEWILKGSEEMIRWPNLQWREPTYGIDTFGTKKIDGQTCVVIANEEVKRAESLGWTVVSIKTSYAYIVH